MNWPYFRKLPSHYPKKYRLAYALTASLIRCARKGNAYHLRRFIIYLQSSIIKHIQRSLNEDSLNMDEAQFLINRLEVGFRHFYDVGGDHGDETDEDDSHESSEIRAESIFTSNSTFGSNDDDSFPLKINSDVNKESPSKDSFNQ